MRIVGFVVRGSDGVHEGWDEILVGQGLAQAGGFGDEIEQGFEDVGLGGGFVEDLEDGIDGVRLEQASFDFPRFDGEPGTDGIERGERPSGVTRR